MKWAQRLLCVIALAALPGWTHGGQAPAIIYNALTYTSCNGVADDVPGFAAWRSDALTFQAAHPGALIELSGTSAANTCTFLTGAPSPSIFAGLKNFIFDGGGATLSDGGGVGGYFLGGGVTAGVQSNGTASTARIATVAAGSTTITLLDVSKCSLYNSGEKHLITGVDLQGTGSAPPNPGFWEYVQIGSTASCAGTGSITITAPLTNGYKSTWPLYDAGAIGSFDQGGPGTLYQLGQNWDIVHEYRNLTISQVGQTYSWGKNITFRNVTMTGSACAVPTQNETWSVINSAMTNCGIEVDKLNGTMTLQGTTVRAVDFQSASVAQFNFINSTATSFINGGGKKNTISGSTIAAYTPGAHSFGASGEVAVSNTSLPLITIGGASQSFINLRGAWAGGQLSVPNNFSFTSASAGPGGVIRLLVNSTAGYATGFVTDITVLGGSNSCHGTWPLTVVSGTQFDLQGSTFSGTCSGNGGSLPLNWAEPGENICFFGRWRLQGPCIQVNDMSQDATFTKVQTTLAGGFPVMPLNASGGVDVFVHPAPKFTCTNCTGSDDAIDLSNPGAAGVPIWSYSKRIYTQANGAPTTPVVPLFGALTSLNVTVNSASSAAGAMTFNINNPFVQIEGSSSTSTHWNPIVNAKVASGTPRNMTQTTTSGAQSGDTLVAAGTGARLVNDQVSPEFSTAPAGGDPVSVTVEFTTNQGVVYP